MVFTLSLSLSPFEESLFHCCQHLSYFVLWFLLSDSKGDFLDRAFGFELGRTMSLLKKMSLFTRFDRQVSTESVGGGCRRFGQWLLLTGFQYVITCACSCLNHIEVVIVN